MNRKHFHRLLQRSSLRARETRHRSPERHVRDTVEQLRHDVVRRCRRCRRRGRVRLRTDSQRQLRGEHHHYPVRSVRAGGVGSGTQVAVHVVRLLREGGHFPTIPGGHAARGHRQLPRRQPAVLDADPGGQGTVGVRGVGHRQNRTDHDHGPGHQGRGEQVRHAGAQLRGSRWQANAHTAGRPQRLRHPAEDHVQVPEDQELRTVRVRRVVHVLPGVQVPRLDERALPVCHPGVSVPLPRTQVPR